MYTFFLQVQSFFFVSAFHWSFKDKNKTIQDDININKSRKKTGGTIKYMYFIVKYISELLNLLYITVYCKL